MFDNQDIASVLATIDSLQRKLADLRKNIYRDIRTTELTSGKADLLSCYVGTTLLALPLERVRTVVQRCALTPIPEAPHWVAGLLDYRGALLPVLDLHARLVGSPAPTSLSDVLLLCSQGDRWAALLAQGIGQVHLGVALESGDDLDDVPHAAYVMAMAHLKSALAPVLSTARLLAALELPEEATRDS
jgi:chemotaxis signal transduction protein